MKTIRRLAAPVAVLCLAVAIFCGCANGDKPAGEVTDAVTTTASGTDKTEEPINEKDFAGEIKLDMNSQTLKQSVSVKTYIDGDTTHFTVPRDVIETGVLKARYLAINTPESTGKIEEFGKKASRFTKEKLSSAVSIMIESDDGKWNLDSTGGRHLVWVWYKTSEAAEYRNLNIEILQNGLAIASSSANNRYGTVCVAAIAQAKALKLNVYSGEKDPEMYYGEAIELTLKELRCNIAAYNGMKVAFQGVITKNNNNSVYIEDYDSETDMYFGISCYYGFNLTGEGLEVLTVGNLSRIVGTVQYYEAGGTYQVSDMSYRLMKPNDPNNIQKISDGHKPAYVKTDAEKFLNAKVSVTVNGTDTVFDYAALAMNTSLSMEGLKVTKVYTTSNEDSSSFGAMTLTCSLDGKTITVRTVVLYDGNGKMITEDAYKNKNINVRGLVDYFDGEYQIKVFSAKDITINN